MTIRKKPGEIWAEYEKGVSYNMKLGENGLYDAVEQQDGEQRLVGGGLEGVATTFCVLMAIFGRRGFGRGEVWDILAQLRGEFALQVVDLAEGFVADLLDRDGDALEQNFCLRLNKLPNAVLSLLLLGD